MKAAIVIDDWKLSIFERYLKNSGFNFEKGPGVTQDTLSLFVETTEPERLALVVKTANIEAAKISNITTGVTQ